MICSRDIFDFFYLHSLTFTVGSWDISDFFLYIYIAFQGLRFIHLHAHRFWKYTIHIYRFIVDSKKYSYSILIKPETIFFGNFCVPYYTCLNQQTKLIFSSAEKQISTKLDTILYYIVVIYSNIFPLTTTIKVYCIFSSIHNCNSSQIIFSEIINLTAITITHQKYFLSS